MPEGLGRYLDGIENLFYIYRPLKYIKRSAFKDLGSGLSKLGLFGNQIENIPFDMFYDIPKIETLELSDNKLKTFEPETFANVPKLTNLDIDLNQITALHFDLLKNLPNLKVFDAKYN